MFIQVTTYQGESRERWLVMGWEQKGAGSKKGSSEQTREVKKGNTGLEPKLESAKLGGKHQTRLRFLLSQKRNPALG